MKERKVYIDTRSATGIADLLFELRTLAERRRQFAVTFDADGCATIATPDLAHRDPANPQPTPPQEIAQRRAA